MRTVCCASAWVSGHLAVRITRKGLRFGLGLFAKLPQRRQLAFFMLRCLYLAVILATSHWCGSRSVALLT
jgi:hypothetical protein